MYLDFARRTQRCDPCRHPRSREIHKFATCVYCFTLSGVSHSSIHETLQQGIDERDYQEKGCGYKKKSMTEEVLRVRLIMIQLLVTKGMRGDLEKLGIGKVILWETLR